uniref:ubiquitinyl hydrolase 1 n=1 Tax=Timema bartmani TaxID=61472 RepID=A0A7R9EPI8_9NEOP|nr:unnamed protein product [Timema bartmani]
MFQCHSGILGGGHYVSYACNPNGKWYCYNDSSCKEINMVHIDTSSAYMLFYEREGLDHQQYMPSIAGKTADTRDLDDEFDSDLKKLCCLMVMFGVGSYAPGTSSGFRPLLRTSCGLSGMVCRDGPLLYESLEERRSSDSSKGAYSLEHFTWNEQNKLNTPNELEQMIHPNTPSIRTVCRSLLFSLSTASLFLSSKASICLVDCRSSRTLSMSSNSSPSTTASSVSAAFWICSSILQHKDMTVDRAVSHLTAMINAAQDIRDTRIDVILDEASNICAAKSLEIDCFFKEKGAKKRKRLTLEEIIEELHDDAAIERPVLTPLRLRAMTGSEDCTLDGDLESCTQVHCIWKLSSWDYTISLEEKIEDRTWDYAWGQLPRTYLDCLRVHLGSTLVAVLSGATLPWKCLGETLVKTMSLSPLSSGRVIAWSCRSVKIDVSLSGLNIVLPHLIHGVGSPGESPSPLPHPLTPTLELSRLWRKSSSLSLPSSL